MADLGVAFDLVGWRDRRGRFSQETADLTKRMHETANDVMQQLRKAGEELSPVGKTEPKDGVRFKDAWKFEIVDSRDGVQGTLINTSPHAVFVIEPTKPHDISPKNGDVLHFTINGEDVFTRGPVHHPGTPGNDVAGKLSDRMGKIADEALGKVAAKVISDLEAIFK